MFFKIICKNFTKTSATNPISQLRSVVNIEREDFYPFLHPVMQNYLPNLKKKSSSYAIVYPKDITNFLNKQEEQFNDTENNDLFSNINIS